MPEPSTLIQELAPAGGRRQTAQREQISNTLEKASGPLTAVQLVELARQEVPDVGLSTVYRALKKLQEANLVRLVILPDGVARYEKAGRGPHHFLCRACGGIWTLQNGTVTTPRYCHLEGGFAVEDDEIIFYGHCSNCHPAPEATR